MASWSIAVSGGGHRASLFGLGALLYVADAGLNQEVTSIASVSGGSITNGYLGATLNYRAVSGEQLRNVVRPLVRRCSVLGTVQWARESVALCLGIVVGIALAVAAWWIPVWAWLHAVLSLIGLALALIAIQARSWVADRVFRRLLFSKAGKPFRLADLAAEVTHVLCATEVQSAEHVYFSRNFSASYQFGVSTGSAELPVSTAVQCSACFPGGFPARTLSAKRLGFTARSRLLLVDGGVYDNMGDQWAQGFRDRLLRWPELAHLAGPAPENLIVVNASTRRSWSPASALVRIPLVGEVVTLLKEKDILYQVGTATRRSNLIDQFDARRLAERVPADANESGLPAAVGLGGTLVHIGSTALWTRNPGASGADADACAAVVGALDAFPDQQWVHQAPQIAAGVKTTLAKIGKKPAAALLWHGYVLTMTNLHVFYGTPLLELPTRQEFEQMMA